MFNKKIKLFLITLVFMLSLSAVSAVDVNLTDDMIAGDADEEPPSGSIESISADEGDVLQVLDSEPVIENSDVLKIDENTDNISQSGESESSNIIITAKDASATYGNTITYKATFSENEQPLKGTNVKFIINGKTYNEKTDSKGVASLKIKLNVGSYKVQIIHPEGYNITKTITFKTSVSASNLNKRYLSSKTFKATFYGKNGKVLANKYIKFYIKGTYYTKKTNSKGVATLKIISKPGTYKIKSINTQTGEKKTNTIKVSSTLKASKMTVFSDKSSTFKVTLYKNEKLVKNAKVYIYIKGNKILAKTNSKGVASVNFKLAKGTYYFKSVDPYTGYSIKTKVVVKLASIKASNLIAHENKTSAFKATLLKQNGKAAANTNMQMTVNGQTYTVKTNSKGVASLNINLKQGSYKITCKDLSTGYTLSKKITVMKSNVGMKYNQYGVSEDGKTILAIGRASASGEMSKYGYSFHMTEFLRICPYCGSDELYWSIFWAGSETANYGVFPATGHKEGGSAEGHIFCAHCDCDWSVYGNNHGTGPDLTIVSPTVASSKEAAYLLKSGNYVHS